MSAQEIDDYLATLDETKRSTLEQLRASILSVVPEAEQGLSYSVPAFLIEGKAVAGFYAAKNHLSYIPHSGNILANFAAELGEFTATKGVLKMPVGTPIPVALVRKLIDARRNEAGV